MEGCAHEMQKATEKAAQVIQERATGYKKTTRRFEHFHCCSTTRVKRLGRFYWYKDKVNSLKDNGNI